MKVLESKIKLSSLNGHLICGLCGGYLVDATVITECVHVFCRSCIVKYLAENKVCPLCQSLIQQNRPGQSLRPDVALQRIVYKLVPGLLKTELQRMMDFCSPTNIPTVEGMDLFQNGTNTDEFCHPPLPVALTTRSLSKSPSALPPALNTRRDNCTMNKLPVSMTFLIGDQELLSVSLTYMRPSRSHLPIGKHSSDQVSTMIQPEKNIFILCPAIVNVSTLHQLLLAKYQLDPSQKTVEIYLDGECLEPVHTLREVVFLYHFPARQNPLKLDFIFSDPRLAWWGQPMPRLEPTQKVACKNLGMSLTSSVDVFGPSPVTPTRVRESSISDDEKLYQCPKHKSRRVSI